MKTNTSYSRSAFRHALDFNYRLFIALCLGLVVGFCMAKFFIITTQGNSDGIFNIDDDHHRLDNVLIAHSNHHNVSHTHTYENSSVAVKLFSEVRVLCWIMTSPREHKSKAIHVKRTWGKRCNKLLFMSSEADEELNSIALNVSEGRNNLWAKTKEAFKYIYANHLNEADWFFKADDDTYAIVENLRYLLYPYNPKTPVYFGCKFKPFVKQGYMSGGGGYVLSKEALRRFVTVAIPQKRLCSQDEWGEEDVEIGKCLENVNVVAGDSRDPQGINTFFGVGPDYLLLERDKTFWYWHYVYYKVDEGFDCCSDNAITFHYIPSQQMYVMDYMIYHLRPYGVVNTLKQLPEKLNEGEILSFSDVSDEAIV